MVPGPIYDTGVKMGKDVKFFSSRDNSPTFINKIILQKKNVPGVGQYNVKDNKRILGTYTQKVDRIGPSDHEVYMSQNIPSYYDPVDMNVYKNRILVTRFTKPLEKPPQPKVNESSVLTYRYEDSYDKTQQKQHRFTISKSPKQTFTDHHIKRKNFIPGPGKYDITKGQNMVTIGVRKGYK